jgi:hypothetical protein
VKNIEIGEETSKAMNIDRFGQQLTTLIWEMPKAVERAQ